MPADLPTLAQSSFIVAPTSSWEQLWETYTVSAHPSDLWQPEEWGKPLAVKDVKNVRHFAGQQAVGLGRYIALPQADTMSREVANALLKLLEEPPAGLSVILFAETDRMLATIRSRVLTIIIESDGDNSQRLTRFYRSLDPLREPALTRRFLYYAPLLHATIQPDLIVDAFQS